MKAVKISNKLRSQLNRRQAIGGLASAFTFSFIPSSVFGANQRLQIASVGVGGKGRSDFDQLARHGEVIAACDVDRKRLNFALQSYPRARKYSDCRKMIEELGDRIDVLCISAPDHSHALAAQRSMHAGIHLFVQAPLSHTVWEARQLTKLAKKKKLCTQMGIQGTAQDGFREGVEYLRSGRLGDVEEIHVWGGLVNWPQAPKVTKKPEQILPVPGDLNWSGFLGSALPRPYHPCYHPHNWRGWIDFGTGLLGSTGCHLLNLPVMGCELPAPQKVSCLHRGPVNRETYPAWASLRYEFEQPGKRSIHLNWYEGRIGHLSEKIFGQPNLPTPDLFSGHSIPATGVLIVGKKGKFLTLGDYGTRWKVHYGREWIEPEQALAGVPRIFPRNNRGDSGMKEELIRAIRLGEPAICLANFEYASRLSEICLLGNMAILEGGEFAWDSKMLRADRTDVSHRISKPYRQGWEVMGESPDPD
jgi:hypothetical protein